jgi:hypothetical protein
MNGATYTYTVRLLLDGRLSSVLLKTNAEAARTLVEKDRAVQGWAQKDFLSFLVAENVLNAQEVYDFLRKELFKGA